jgi:hypothetical protein
MSKGFQYFAGLAWFTPTVWLLSLFLSLDLAGWDDSLAPAPLWLRVADDIVFPMRYLVPSNPYFPQYDHIFGEICILIMFINSIVWAFLLVLLYRLVARFVTTKKHC